MWSDPFYSPEYFTYQQEILALQSDDPSLREFGIQQLTKMADEGDGAAMLVLARFFHYGNDPNLYAATRAYIKAAQLGCWEAYAVLARFYKYPARENAVECVQRLVSEGYSTQYVTEELYKGLIKKPDDEHLYFGKYPFESEGKPTPIYWRVLTQEGSRKLLVTQYCLHWLTSGTAFGDFLPEFYDTSFTNAEKQRLDGEPFFLSVAEAKKYFAGKKDRAATATPYAASKGAFVHGKREGVCWWLRDQGYSCRYKADVLTNGEICDDGDDWEEPGGIRPAIWLKVE